MGRLNKRDRWKGGGAGGTFQYVRGNYEPLKKGTNLTVVVRRHPFISSAW